MSDPILLFTQENLDEIETRDSLIRFALEHPGVVATDNVGEVLAALTECAEQDGP